MQSRHALLSILMPLCIVGSAVAFSPDTLLSVRALVVPFSSEILQRRVVDHERARFRAEVRELPLNAEVPMPIVETYYDTLGPDVLLSVLEEEGYCHERSHSIGKALFAHTRDIEYSLQIARGRCTTGAFHGVLMGAFAELTGSDEHIEAEEVATFARTLCESPSVIARLSIGSCAHGVGHALLSLTDGDISSALKHCSGFNDRGRAYYCASGVYMQRDSDVGERDAQLSQASPCDEPGAEPVACYRYKIPRIFPQNHDAARAYCDSLSPGIQRNGCFHGLGFSIFYAIRTSPTLLTLMCSGAGASEERLCIEGAIHALTPEAPRSEILVICAELSGSAKDACTKAATTDSFSLENDFSLYTNR